MQYQSNPRSILNSVLNPTSLIVRHLLQKRLYLLFLKQIKIIIAETSPTPHLTFSHQPHLLLILRKNKNKKRKSNVDSPDDIAQNSMNGIGHNLLDELEKMLAKVASMPYILLQSFIQSILARCLTKSSDNMVKLSSIDNRNYVATSTYMKIPRVTACKPASSAGDTSYRSMGNIRPWGWSRRQGG